MRLWGRARPHVCALWAPWHAGHAGAANPSSSLPIVLISLAAALAAMPGCGAVAQQGVPVYAYEFVYKTNHWLDGLLLRDYHMSELPFVWQNWALTEAGAPVAQIPWPQFRFPRWVVTDKDHTMGRTFAKYWTNMARANSPKVANRTCRGKIRVSWICTPYLVM